MKARAKKRTRKIKCPRCGGSGQIPVGRSIQMNRAIYYGYPSTYDCECCYGTGRVPKGTNPDWWKVSDNATPGR